MGWAGQMPSFSRLDFFFLSIPPPSEDETTEPLAFCKLRTNIMEEKLIFNYLVAAAHTEGRWRRRRGGWVSTEEVLRHEGSCPPESLPSFPSGQDRLIPCDILEGLPCQINATQYWWPSLEHGIREGLVSLLYYYDQASLAEAFLPVRCTRWGDGEVGIQGPTMYYYLLL